MQLELSPSQDFVRLNPYGLWSLREMLEIHAAAFVEALAKINALQAVMISMGKAHPNEMGNPLNGYTKNHVLEDLRTIAACCPAFGARLTKIAAERMIKSVEAGDSSYREAPEELTAIRSRLLDELSSAKLFGLSADEASYYNETVKIFGSDVAAKFPASVIDDIDEAGKCLALARPTASVFHLMRVMEAALQAFAAKLGVALPDTKVWQVLLDGVNKAIKALPPKSQATVAYAEISAHLYNVKLAWRNEVMHPKETYTPDQAKDVLNSVRAFLGNLAGVL